MFESNRIPMYDVKFQPQVSESAEFAKILDIMTAHTLAITVNADWDFGHKKFCLTCGEVQIGEEQEFHITHQLLLAGIGDKATTLNNAALEAHDRGDVGKEDEDGVSVVDFLKGRARIIEEMTAENFPHGYS